jgi:hypothetical protein
MVLRSVILILVIKVAAMAGQVAPPDLRCISVDAVGTVTLQWIPPADIQGQFQGYEIWTSVFRTSGYSSLSTVVTPVSTFSFSHSAPSTTAQTTYYYMVSRSAAGNSVTSDTLRTIFLNIYSSTSDLQIVYNTPAQPLLPSSSSNFTITREYPPGTIKNLGITSAGSFADTIETCTANITYQVSMSDAANCASRSNPITGIYFNVKKPDQPLVDSISVLPDGRTVLAWAVPRDKDISKYYIIESVPPNPNTYIDSVSGRPSTLYTHKETSANNRPVSLYVSAFDSCGNIGAFDTVPQTMHLDFSYSRCEYKTSLSWNRYRGMKGGLLEYRIYYSANGGNFVHVGTTTLTTFTHEKANPGSNLCYFVRAVNKNATVTSSSNRCCFFSAQADVPSFLYLSSASVRGDHSVDVSFLVDHTRPVRNIDVERSEDGAQFAKVGEVAFTGAASYVFSDLDAEPGSRSYYYRLTIRDSCGNTRGNSNVARTVHLKVTPDDNHLFIHNLSWNDYAGFAGGTSGYYVYRLVNDERTGAPVGQTGPGILSFTDNLEAVAEKGALVSYRVQAIEGLNNPHGIEGDAYSNTVPVYTEGRLFVPNAFAPTGANQGWKPITHFIDPDEYRVMVFDRWGKEIFSTNNTQETWYGAGYSAGVYAYLIRYKNSRGEYRELSGSITLIR